MGGRRPSNAARRTVHHGEYKRLRKIQSRTNTRSGDPTDSRGKRWKHPVIWISSAVFTAVIGALATVLVTTGLINTIHDRLAGGRHLVWTVEPEPQAVIGENWAFALPLPRGAVPPNNDSFYAWVAARHGLRVGRTDTRIELTNRRLAELRITELRAVIVQRGTAFHGTQIFGTTAGAGDIAQVGFRLDDLDPIARVKTNEPAYLSPNGNVSPGATGAPYFSTNGDIVLDQGQTMTVMVTGFANRGEWFAWKIEATVRIGRSTTTETIDNNGKPFETTGSAKAYQVEYYRDIGTPFLRMPTGCPPATWCKSPLSAETRIISDCICQRKSSRNAYDKSSLLWTQEHHSPASACLGIAVGSIGTSRSSLWRKVQFRRRTARFGGLLYD